MQLDPWATEAWHQTCAIVKKHAILWHTMPFEPFHIFVDSSDFASGSVLMQKKDGSGTKDKFPDYLRSRSLALPPLVEFEFPGQYWGVNKKPSITQIYAANGTLGDMAEVKNRSSSLESVLGFK